MLSIRYNALNTGNRKPSEEMLYAMLQIRHVMRMCLRMSVYIKQHDWSMANKSLYHDVINAAHLILFAAPI